MGRKGSVSVLDDRGRLRLRWRFRGRRWSMAMDLPSTPQARLLAEQVARQIELDILSGHFDETLNRYRDGRGEDRTLGELLGRFIGTKERSRDPRTLEKYRAIANHLADFGEGDRPLNSITDAVAGRVAAKLRRGMGDRTTKEHLTSLAAAWDWGVGDARPNPWRAIAEEIRLQPRQPPKPFSQDEVNQILVALRSRERWAHYHDFVAFLFCTGCRTGEAIALRWEHLSADCSVAWIGESHDGSRRKATKTRRAREVMIVPGMQRILQARSLNRSPQDLVFPALQGGYIQAHNFRNRVWIPALKAANVPYRKPYNTRHTAISHSIAAGNNPTDVAQQVGNTARVIFTNYAGAIGKPKMVDFLIDPSDQPPAP